MQQIDLQTVIQFWEICGFLCVGQRNVKTIDSEEKRKNLILFFRCR